MKDKYFLEILRGMGYSENVSCLGQIKIINKDEIILSPCFIFYEDLFSYDCYTISGEVESINVDKDIAIDELMCRYKNLSVSQIQKYSNVFANYVVGDYISFTADIYANFKELSLKASKFEEKWLITYCLKNCFDIEKIDKDTFDNKISEINKVTSRQAIEEIVCETCLFQSQCVRINCLLSNEEFEKKVKSFEQIDDFLNLNIANQI